MAQAGIWRKRGKEMSKYSKAQKAKLDEKN
jgi:hypothetical protein